MKASVSSEWRRQVAAAAICAGFLTSTAPAAAQERIATLEERFTGAERVVVATARSVGGTWRQNIHGDRIIVSRVRLVVDETLKGAPANEVWMEIEGGTIGGWTLEVSSLPLMTAGDRAVFFLNADENNVHHPYLKGQGILDLEGDMVRGSSLHLNQIRSAARIRQ